MLHLPQPGSGHRWFRLARVATCILIACGWVFGPSAARAQEQSSKDVPVEEVLFGSSETVEGQGSGYQRR